MFIDLIPLGIFIHFILVICLSECSDSPCQACKLVTEETMTPFVETGQLSLYHCGIKALYDTVKQHGPMGVTP